MLDGQGGDEMLAGYHDLRLPVRRPARRRTSRERRPSSRAYRVETARASARGRALARRSCPSVRAPAAARAGGAAAALVHPTAPRADVAADRPPTAPARPPAPQMHLILTQRGLPELLHYEDRNSMAHSLEARVPFLDYRLVELLYGLDARQLYERGTTKVVLRRRSATCSRRSSATGVDKLGFVTPEQRCFRGALGDFADDVFRSREFAERGLVDAAEALARLRAAPRGSAGPGSSSGARSASSSGPRRFRLDLQPLRRRRASLDDRRQPAAVHQSGAALAGSRRRGDRGGLIHSGQHYDAVMSEVFYEELGLREPSHLARSAHGRRLRAGERHQRTLVQREQPDWVIVFGDTNTTLAGARAAERRDVPLAHIEAGLRSGDLAMPEERNRIEVDRVADLLLCPDEYSRATLAAEGCRNAGSRRGRDGGRRPPLRPARTERFATGPDAPHLRRRHRAPGGKRRPAPAEPDRPGPQHAYRASDLSRAPTDARRALAPRPRLGPHVSLTPPLGYLGARRPGVSRRG